jgi:hypothetical protein
MTVENVVMKAELGRNLNLDFIKLGLGDEAEFNPKSFPGVVYRPKKKEKGRETILVFKTGRLVCTGAKSPEKGRELIIDFANRLRDLGVEIPIFSEPKPHSAREMDEKVTEVLDKAENIYTDYCIYGDSWSTPRGHAGGFVKRWIDRKQVRKELENITSGDVKQILGELSILTDNNCMNVLHSIMEDMKSLEEISKETGIEQIKAKQYLDLLKKTRLQWGTFDMEGSQMYVAWGGRVLLHLLSMIQKLVLEPSEWSIVGREELYH